MIVGVDVDEVLTRFVDTFLPYYNKIHGTNWKKENIRTYYFYKVFGITKSEDMQAIEEFGKTKEYREMPLVEGAIDGIKKLGMKNELHIITGRPADKRSIVEELVEKNFYNCFSSICLSEFNPNLGFSTPKYKYCKNLEIELMIEDMPDSAKEISRECNIPVLVPKYPWNKNADFSGTKCTLVDGWKGIIEYSRENKIINA